MKEAKFVILAAMLTPIKTNSNVPQMMPWSIMNKHNWYKDYKIIFYIKQFKLTVYFNRIGENGRVDLNWITDFIFVVNNVRSNNARDNGATDGSADWQNIKYCNSFQPAKFE